jgi:hypothetical protein
LSGLAPAAVYLSACLILGIGALWVVAKLLKWPSTRTVGVLFLAVTGICVGYLSIEKFVGVHYTQGFYLAMALMAVVGMGTGFALRRGR